MSQFNSSSCFTAQTKHTVPQNSRIKLKVKDKIQQFLNWTLTKYQRISSNIRCHQKINIITQIALCPKAPCDIINK